MDEGARLLALLLLTIRLTLPAFNAVPNGCEPGADPLSGLDSLLFTVQPVHPVAPARTVAGFSVRGQEGESIAVELPLSADSAYSLMAYTRDIAGKRSCPAFVALGSWPLSVSTVQLPPHSEWFDIAGRRVRRPETPGIYFWRRGSLRGQIAVVR